MPIPMPNDKLGETTVVASCFYRDLTESDDIEDDWPDVVYLVLLLNKEEPFFTVAHVADESGGWRILDSDTRHNIVQSVRVYEDWGGDI